MTEYFIHIGLPRTATTFLQTQFFPFLKGLSFYGLPYTHFNLAFQKMLFQDESLYDKNEFIGEVSKLSGDKILLSNENFVGQSLFLNHSNRSRTAERMRIAMPEATILLFLRNQVDLLQSLYSISIYDKEIQTEDRFVQFPKKGYSLEDWNAQRTDDWKNYAYYNTFNPTEHLDNYLFEPLIELYQKKFPRVEIFLYEDLLHNPEDVFNRLKEIFETESVEAVRPEGTKVNSSLSQKQMDWVRFLNQFYPLAEGNKIMENVYHKSKRWILKWKMDEKKFSFDAELKTRIEKFYAENNKICDQKHPELGLNRYPEKYFISSELKSLRQVNHLHHDTPLH